MKKLYTIFAVILFAANVFAQSPEKMSYQAVIRDASDNLVTSQDIGLQISILQGSTSGTAVYVETQMPTSNANGLVSVEVGNGTVISGNFTNIDWANGPYFIKTETDPTGGTTYTITGTSQLLSVPYALHAKKAETLTGTITETDPIFGASVASGITATDTTNWNNKLNAEVDGSVTNELQALSISNDTIYLSNGNFVKLPTTSETDPLFVTSVASSIATTDTARWNNKQNQLTSGTGISIINNIISAVAGGTHYLGEEYLDGIIFYLYIGNDGLQHGLVVSKVESTGNWGDEITVVGADRTEDGLYNTNMMSASSTAKIWVQSLGTDWYLPSQDEFSLLWHNRFHVNKTARTIGSAIITNGQSYWTSTEYDVSHAFYYAVAYGWTDYSYYSKSNNCRIRAIRSF